MAIAVGGCSVVVVSNDVINHAANDVDFSTAIVQWVAITIAPIAAVILRATATAITTTAACGAALA